MLLVKKRVDEFKSIISMIRSITPEVDFIFSNEGMKVRAIHPSNSCMLNVNIDKDFFDKINFDKHYVLTLNTELLDKIIKKLGKKEIEIDIIDNLIILKNSITKFELKYYVGKEDERETPKNEYDVEMEVSKDNFFSQIEDLKEFSEIVNLIYNNGLKVITKGTLIKSETIVPTKVFKSKDTSVWYGLEFLLLFNGMESLTNQIKVCFGNSTPIEISCVKDNIKLVGLLAPRMEE